MTDEKRKRIANPIKFSHEFVLAYIKATNDGLTLEDFATSQNVDSDKIRFLKSRINEIRTICRSEGRIFPRLKSSKLSRNEKVNIVRELFGTTDN